MEGARCEGVGFSSGALSLSSSFFGGEEWTDYGEIRNTRTEEHELERLVEQDKVKWVTEWRAEEKPWDEGSEY